jgi:hypothetical protein
MYYESKTPTKMFLSHTFFCKNKHFLASFSPPFHFIFRNQKIFILFYCPLPSNNERSIILFCLKKLNPIPSHPIPLWEDLKYQFTLHTVIMKWFETFYQHLCKANTTYNWNNFFNLLLKSLQDWVYGRKIRNKLVWFERDLWYEFNLFSTSIMTFLGNLNNVTW